MLRIAVGYFMNDHNDLLHASEERVERNLRRIIFDNECAHHATSKLKAAAPVKVRVVPERASRMVFWYVILIH